MHSWKKQKKIAQTKTTTKPKNKFALILFEGWLRSVFRPSLTPQWCAKTQREDLTLTHPSKNLKQGFLWATHICCAKTQT